MPEWRPSITPNIARQRAACLSKIHQFFAERQVMAVETPLLAPAPVTDPYLQAFALQQGDTSAYLQTSPEYAMKRMLAAGFGDIYQICKAFRQEEVGRLHQTEFTLLEWYRLDYDHHQLMDEMDALLQYLFDTPNSRRITYAQAFQTILQIDPYRIDLAALQALTARTVGSIQGLSTPLRDDCLQLLFSQVIEPTFQGEQPVLVYDYPASQAALAKIRQQGDIAVAERFELYYQGIELANGYHELTDPVEQEKRFMQDLAMRVRHKLPAVPIDSALLAAMQAGLPKCAGVALGLDRLLVCALKQDRIDRVLMSATGVTD